VDDPETGTFYNAARQYWVLHGAFTQMDPIGMAGGSNRRIYGDGNPLTFADPTGNAATGAAIGGAVGGAIGGRFGGSAGARAGAAFGARAGSAIEDFCRGGPNCDELNEKVKEAKSKAAQLGACRAGMSRFELQARYDAWVELGAARAKRDENCWAGGDAGHQQAQADAWTNAGNCSRLMK
jgi:type VI secretion system secreted protein VgrG